MTTETQGITPKDNINQAHSQAQNQPQILRIKTGALSVLSYSPTLIVRQELFLACSDFNLMSFLCGKLNLYTHINVNCHLAGVPEPGLNRQKKGPDKA